METLYAIGAWLREHWLELVILIVLIAVITGIALLPLPYRKMTLAIIAALFIVLSVFLIWWALAHDHAEAYDVVVPFVLGVICGVIGIPAAIWAAVIW